MASWAASSVCLKPYSQPARHSVISILMQLPRKLNWSSGNRRNFSPEGILDSLIKCVIKGKGSFRDIASTLAPVEKNSMSRQGIFLRINASCVTFLSQTAHALIALQAKPVEKICSKFGVERILTEWLHLQENEFQERWKLSSSWQ